MATSVTFGLPNALRANRWHAELTLFAKTPYKSSIRGVRFPAHSPRPDARFRLHFRRKRARQFPVHPRSLRREIRLSQATAAVAGTAYAHGFVSVRGNRPPLIAFPVAAQTAVAPNDWPHDAHVGHVGP